MGKGIKRDKYKTASAGRATEHGRSLERQWEEGRKSQKSVKSRMV